MDIEMNDMHSWTDFDGAMFCVGKALGMIGDDVSSIRDIKVLLWTDNVETRCLIDILDTMVRVGYMECDQSGHKYRIAPSFTRIKVGDKGTDPKASE